MKRLPLLLLSLCFLNGPVHADSSDTTETLFKNHCAACHGANRLGLMGPALLPENLHRLKKKEAFKVIQQGRPASQMPPFEKKLGAADIQALVDFIYTPPEQQPTWDIHDIAASQIVEVSAQQLPAKPVWQADPMNLFIVVELGDHHATLLDGNTFEPIHRFQTRFALHGGPKYSPTGRYVYFGSRDGWITKYDLYNLKVVAEVRAGINMRNIAVSHDGRYVIAGNYLPHSLVIFSAEDLSPLKVIAATSGDASSRISAVYDAAPRNSFIAALKDIREVWEIPYADNPLPVYNGPMHDYRMDEGVARQSGQFPVRKIKLDDYLDDFFFDQDYKLLIGAARNQKNGQVINLDVGRKIAELDLDGMPHLGSGISWTYQGRPVLATPNLKQGEISIIDMQNWKTIKRIKTLGPGFFMRSHENSDYAWADVFFGPNRDAVHIIDKRTLEIVKTLRPEPGKTAAHVEFDKTGEHALLSIWDMDGAVIVYDAKTLEEIKRLPMKKPSGKYNVHNKITRSAGTSH